MSRENIFLSQLIIALLLFSLVGMQLDPPMTAL
jgi:hypothetical protein